MNERDMVYKTVFKPGLAGATSKQKATVWESVWKDYMFGFWSGIRNIYKDEQLWEPGTQLMYRATLEVIQDNYLEAKALAGIAFSDPVVLREDVEKFYKNVVGGFFHTEWKRKELLTDDGRRVLRDALNVMRVPGTKLRQLVSSHPLFTGAGSKAKVSAGGAKAEKKEKKPK